MLLDRGADYNKCDYHDESPVMKACEHGHTEIVKMLLDIGADYNKCDYHGESPVMKACEHGHTEIVKMLLDIGADYNKCDYHGESPVMKACKHGHTEIVKMLLDRGADYNKCDDDGQSPVMKACEHGHTEIVKMLLDRGADNNKCDRRGESPVMKACEHGHTEISPVMKACKHGHTEIVKILLDRGADYNKCDNKCQSPVMKACKHGHTEIVKMLLDRGADYNKCDNRDRGADYNKCDNRVGSPLMKACEHGHTEIVKMLLDIGADYNKCDDDGQSPVMKSCQHGHTEIVNMLLDRGADYNKCDWRVGSPLMKACEHGHTEIVKMLLDIGADYNKCDDDGQSPLMKACQLGHTEIVKILLDRGADYNKCDYYGQSPVMKSCQHGHTEIVNMLLDRGADYNKCDWRVGSPLMKACEHGHTEIVKMLLDRGADYNKCDWRVGSPLMKACEHGHTEIVKMLLDRGADYNKCDCDGQSPVTMATQHAHVEIVKMLLDKAADYNKCDCDGQSPVTMATQHAHAETVKMLLDKAADYNKCDKDGQSPVTMATQHGPAETVKIVGDREADFSPYDKWGQSPVTMATQHGPAETVKIVGDREADFSPCDKWGQSPVKMACENDYTEKDARSSAPMDVLCDGIHLVCFTDTRLDMKCVYYANSFIKEKTTLHGRESSLLKCDGHLIDCIQDERLSRTFESFNNKSLKSIVCEDQTIPDFVKLTYLSGGMKRKACSSESWEDMFLFTTVNKKTILCYFLLANVENIMITEQSKYHDILQQGLCNAMKNQDKATARAISWFIVRNFFRSLNSSLKETIVDTWPAFECKCDNTEAIANFCSFNMIIIIETKKVCNDFPKTFWKVKVKCTISDKIEKNECKEIYTKLQTSHSEVHFPNKVTISGVDAKKVFTEHSNLTLICRSSFKSKGFLNNEHEFVDIPCVQLYCKSKGVIPVGESHFPKTICGLQTDILEGSPCYLARIRVGDKIGSDELKMGTLGGFLLIRGVKTFLTCLHVFLNVDELSAENISLDDEKLTMVKFYPRNSAVQNSYECGYIRDIAFQVDNEKETSIDAALIEFTADTSIDSQDYMALENGTLSYVDVGMNSHFLNNSCVDYRPLCFSTPRPILQTVSVGAISGYSHCKISEVLENKEKSVDLESIEESYSKVVLDEVMTKAKFIICSLQAMQLAGIPTEQTIVQNIEQICDPNISPEIKAIILDIVKTFYTTIQNNTNESVENIMQKVALHHTKSSFSAIIGNVHMQHVILRKTGDNMTTKRTMRRVYNQLYISNIPFQPGDSGTCIYVLSPVKGCIGMAIANHPLGGCIATPIMDILKYFKIGIKVK
ncbi:unnamed protein product [Mytilus coruscus]|uniref:Uncharacterized protein n=1 Tax=Mytilus coruscus TaxID=42192 RepID=A0A6J8DHG8_MYTCO|nr:unnamed protein product [Mytilus coruscus]